jgi:hypothetical protein
VSSCTYLDPRWRNNQPSTPTKALSPASNREYRNRWCSTSFGPSARNAESSRSIRCFATAQETGPLAFLDGYGIEFELPLENGHIDSWKGAIQGTLPGPWKKTFIHGWQALGEVSHQSKQSRVNLLYLAGLRWRQNWSAFSMTGVERERETSAAHAFLGNYSLFFHRRDTVTYGLESNIKGRGNSGRGLLLMPQMQFRKSRLNLQVGAGWRWHNGTSGPQVGWRLSREF